MCKKFLAISAALALTISLVACGKAESETTIPSSNSATPSVTTQPSETEPTVPETFDATEPSVKEITLVENDDCTVKVTGFDPDNLLGYGVKVFLENKTDKNLMFSVKDVSVNGFMVDPFWAATVAQGKKANETITFLDSDFQENGIETVTEINFTLTVYDNDDILADNLVEEIFTVNP